MKTLKGIKLIAAYMGFDMERQDAYYHDSWDWLMPVIEKIEEEHEVSIIGDECEIIETGYYTATIAIAKTRAGESKIDTVYRAVVEFIEWYNKSKAQ